MGAIALFGETYDDTVRIVEIGGPWSVELCGGTHVEHSSQIGPVAITGESSVGSGLRRVEAAVGIEAFHRLAAERTLVSQLAGSLKVQPSELPGRIEALLERLRVAEKELSGLRAAALSASAATLAQGAVDVGGVALVGGDAHRRAPRPAMSGTWRPTSRASSAAGPAWSRCSRPGPGTVAFAVAVTQPAIAAGWAAGDLAKTFLPAIEGRGGGKKDMAQGAGTQPDGIPAAIEALRAALAAATGEPSGNPNGAVALMALSRPHRGRRQRTLHAVHEIGRTRRHADDAARKGVRLGVDVGTVRVGVAISDPHGVLATPVTTLARNHGRRIGPDSARSRWSRNTRWWKWSWVCPRPCVARTGRRSPPPVPTERPLAARIAPVPVVYVDERLTTVSADRQLSEAGVRGKARRKVVDQVAATRILQNRLDNLAGGGAGERRPRHLRPGARRDR